VSRDDDEKSITTLSSDSAERVSVPPRHKIRKPSSDLNEKDRWREGMKPEDRMKDREVLARLEERFVYAELLKFF